MKTINYEDLHLHIKNPVQVTRWLMADDQTLLEQRQKQIIIDKKRKAIIVHRKGEYALFATRPDGLQKGSN
ncbi:MAG TPA: hypothetical protein VIH28_10145 [Ignavibacteriaceae bacterium]